MKHPKCSNWRHAHEPLFYTALWSYYDNNHTFILVPAGKFCPLPFNPSLLSSELNITASFISFHFLLGRKEQTHRWQRLSCITVLLTAAYKTISMLRHVVIILSPFSSNSLQRFLTTCEIKAHYSTSRWILGGAKGCLNAYAWTCRKNKDRWIVINRVSLSSWLMSGPIFTM